MDILRLENLSKYYTSQSSVVMGLTNINLSFSVGEFVAVTGESGSGKSTLAHILGGILPYEAGELYIYGSPTSHYDESDREKYRRDKVSFISQSYGILEGNTVFENVESALRFCGIDAKEAERKAEDMLKKVDLYEYRTRRAGKLSSGQKQRLSIARALAKPSKVLIADEPTGNLDRENSEKVIALLKKASEDRLVILITHEFDEAKDAATRRIVISDGTVSSDIRLSENAQSSPESVGKSSDSSSNSSEKKGSRLLPYTTALTLKAHPVFSWAVCLLLAFTSFIVFAFLGTFTVALDDSSVKKYSPEAFFNGDPERIVVMRADGGHFSDEELRAILDLKYVESIERWGYSADVSYYYIPEVDYRRYNEVVNGPNYHPLLNPDDIQITEEVKFIENKRFVRTLPLTERNILTDGSAPEGIYEVVSADPNYKTGDTLRVYVRNRREWSISAYFYATFTVVGQTDYGDGLYFSDKLAAALTHASEYASDTSEIKLAGHDKILLAPYQSEHTDGNIESLSGGDMLISEQLAKPYGLVIGSNTSLSCSDKHESTQIRGLYDPAYLRLVLVSDTLFEKLIDLSPQDQISVYIKDYAYTDRVEDALDSLGYLSISPFKSGSAETDAALAAERYITLAVCLAALVLAVVLQLILLRALFSSLYGYIGLMRDVGLTSHIAFGMLAMLLLLYTLIGELFGGAAVLVLDRIGVDKIVGIFKYLDSTAIIYLFAVHMASVFIASISVIRTAKKAIFGNARQKPDIELYDSEEY